MEEITIPFRPLKAEELQGAGDYYQEVHDIYTGRYLEALGVQPTAEHRRYVAEHAPLEGCKFEAVWEQRRSVVADELRILQPKLERNSSVPVVQPFVDTKTTKDGRIDALSMEWRVLKENLEYMTTAMPNIAAASSLSETEEKDLLARTRFSVDFMPAALLAMRMADEAASEKISGASMALTRELEYMRAQVRPSKPSDDEGKETDDERRERLQKELAKLKTDFILPYAGERPKRGSEKVTRVVPWQHLQNHQRIDVPHDLRSVALEPIVVTLDEVREETSRIADSLPLELLTNRDNPDLFVPLRAQLVLSESVRLIGLLAHLLYWVVFRHLHETEKQLAESSIQALKVTVHDLWSTLIASYRDFPMGVSFVMPVFLLSMKRGVQWIFMSRYPAVFGDKQWGEVLCRQLTEQINVLFMQLFDPDCVYARFGVLDSTKQAVKLWRKLDLALASKGQGTSTRMITRKNRTTPALNTLMSAGGAGRPGNVKTRRLLAKSASDTLLTSGAARTGAGKSAAKAGTSLGYTPLPRCRDEAKNRPQMDEVKQEALFKVTCRQLSRLGLEALPTGPGAATASRALARAASAGDTRGASLNGRRRRTLRELAGGRGMSPVRDKRPSTIELMQRAVQS